VERHDEGTSFAYSATPAFSDVPETHSFFAHVQAMRDLGITLGCTATTHCPDTTVTYGQLAVFATRGLLTP
jgi:hypothetical protein